MRIPDPSKHGASVAAFPPSDWQCLVGNDPAGNTLPSMRVLLISTYELGHQPLHVASPAAALAAAGHSVGTLDLSVEEWDEAAVEGADAVAISVPMHTALRLATVAARRIRSTLPELPIAAYGLYAAAADLAEVDRSIAGEYEPDLVSWVDSLNAGILKTGASGSRGRTSFFVPDRSTLPPLSSYARLETDGRERLVGAVEASHGCLHLCRHCPLPTVYNGRFRAVDRNLVLDDIGQLVAAGAEHITFADADFFNGPEHSLRIVRELHERWPELTYDATIKVEHLAAHPEHVEALVDTGCVFVVSAFESLNDEILDILDKGHTAVESRHVLHHATQSGLYLRRPGFHSHRGRRLDDVANIFSFIVAHDLVAATDPIQMSIQLLVPESSLLADHPAFVVHRKAYDPESLTYPWDSPDPRVDLLAAELAEIVERKNRRSPNRGLHRNVGCCAQSWGQRPAAVNSILRTPLKGGHGSPSRGSAERSPPRASLARSSNQSRSALPAIDTSR